MDLAMSLAGVAGSALMRRAPDGVIGVTAITDSSCHTGVKGVRGVMGAPKHKNYEHVRTVVDYMDQSLRFYL